MVNSLIGLLFRLNARGRRIVSANGWVAVVVSVFFLTSLIALAVNGRRLQSSERLRLPVADSQPAAPLNIGTAAPSPVAWQVKPQQIGGRTVYRSIPPAVLNEAIQDAREVWTYLAFSAGLPEEKVVVDKLAQLTTAGAGRERLLTSIVYWRQAGEYWRGPLPIRAMLVESLTTFSAAGSEVTLALLFPASAARAQQIDLATGKVVRSNSLPAFVLQAVMQYDSGARRWLLADYSASGVSAELPAGMLWTEG